jgi:DNA-binding CsgD family transcriptional regulator
MATLMGGAFVGRQRELGQLQAILEEALSGQGQLLMLVGEPGIGKTRLAQELATQAQTRGAQVLWGWCYEAEGAPPFWPWVQPIRVYLQQRDAEQLRSEMGLGAADIAEIVFEVRGKLPGLEPPPALEPEQARFRLFDSITTFLKNAAQSQPLMLVLDDLHWADKPSLLLLQFLARELEGSRLLVVGCYRDLELYRQHPLSDTLAQLSRLPVFQRVMLRGLSQEDTSQFIQATVGIRPPPRLVETVYAHTEGNPFFLKEVIRLLSERGELAAVEIGGPEGIRIPEGVREVIGQRLNRLSEQCNQTLTTASIIGREFDFRLLRTLSGGTTEEQLLRVIDEALEAHLIEELPGRGRERYRFSHALIQQTLAEELSPSRKVRWHARIGEALEELYGTDAEAHASELAHYFSEALTVTGTDKLVHYSLLAGEQALAGYAPEEALSYFQRGLAAKEGQPLDSETAALWFGLGRAQLATFDSHQMPEAVDSLNCAFDYYVQAGDVTRAVAIAEYPFLLPPARLVAVVQLIARALALVPPDSYRAGSLLSRYGSTLYFQAGDYQGAQEAFARALSIAQREKDVALEIQTLAGAAFVDLWHACWKECLEKSLRAMELAPQVDDPLTEVVARETATFALFVTGDLERAQQQAAAVLALAERLRHRGWLCRAFYANQNVSHAKGDWQASRVFNERGIAVSPRYAPFLSTRAIMEYEVGEFSRGDTYLGGLLEAMRLGTPGPTLEHGCAAIGIAVVAHIAGVMGRLDVAQAAARTVLSSPSATPLVITLARVGLALTAVQQGDVAAAEEQYAALQPLRGTIEWIVAGDRLLGLLALSLGWLDKAMGHFEDALTFCRGGGYRPQLAWTCYNYADALLKRNDPLDHEKARTLLEESLAIAHELSMRPLAERVVARQAQTQWQRPAPIYPAGLSQREVEVLRRIAQGKSVRAIAEELVIAEGTARRHVNNIYNKIGATNRAEATRYALTAGLLALDQLPSATANEGGGPGQR